MDQASSFQKAMLTGDPDVMAAVLAPDVRFWSPAVHKPYEGREAVMTLLRAAPHVLQGLTSTETGGSAGRTVLFFTAHVGDRAVEGIDALRFDDAGLVR